MVVFREIVKAKRNKWSFPTHWNEKLKDKWRSYAIRSRNNSRDFTLSYDEFELLMNGSCTFCGSSDKITVDRRDSKIGYVIENCQSCCRDCNVLKHYLNESLFLSQVSKIAKYRNL